MVGETVHYLEEAVFPQLAQAWREAQAQEGSGEQILPTRLPLKRRLAEFRYSVRRPPAEGFSGNLWAIERFRDITPVLVVAVFDGWLVLEPGDIGPLPLSHPVAREIVEAVNGQRLTRGMLSKLLEMGAPLYDGCAVVGIVDYRKWAFGMVAGPAAAGGRPAWTPEMHKILLRPSYEVLLDDWISRRRAGAIDAGEEEAEEGMKEKESSQAVEARMVKAISGPLCLDPSPLVFRTLTLLNYNCKKFRGHLHSEPFSVDIFQPRSTAGGPWEQQPPPPRGAESGSHHPFPSRTLSVDTIRSARIDAFLSKAKIRHGDAGGPVAMLSATATAAEMGAANTPLQQQQQHGPRRFRLLGTIEERREQQNQQASRPLYGLDARKDPTRLGLSAPPPLTWLPPNTALWRTLRFEGKQHYGGGERGTAAAAAAASAGLTGGGEDDPAGRTGLHGMEAVHYTVHILVGAALGYGARGHFEVMVRVGSSPCASDIYPPVTSIFCSKSILDAYVEQLKHMMQIEGKQCVADVSNPNAIASLLRGPAPAPSMMAAAGEGGGAAGPAMMGLPPGYGHGLQVQPGGMLMMRKGMLYGGVAPGLGTASPMLGPTGRMGPPSIMPSRGADLPGAPAMRQLRPPRRP